MSRRSRFDGSSLREKRKALDLTQKQLGDMIGCSRQAICNAEDTRKGGLGPELAKKAATALGVAIESLYKKEQPEGHLAPDEERVVNIMRSSPYAAQALVQFATGLELGLRQAGPR